MNVTKFYRCHNCFSLYDSIDDSQVCCEPEMRYHCGECGHYHSDEIKDEKCCNLNVNEKLKEQLKLG